VRNRTSFLTLLAGALSSACAGRAAVAGPPPVPVVTAVAERKDVPVQILAIGTVEPLSTVTVKPQVGGIIDGVHFREGADVRAGDLLFTIDRRPYEAALRQSESMRARDAAQLQNAQAEARRADELVAQGILSHEQHDQARAASEALAASVRADEAAIENARLQLEYCTIRSPIDGRTGSLLVHQGNLVKAIDGGPLVVVNRVEPVFVTFAVPEQRLAAIDRAMAAGRLVVEAVLPGGEAAPEHGRLTFLDNAVDRATGTIKLKGTFPNAGRRLWPGQFVNARLTLGVRSGAVVVPAQALQSGQRGTFVFVIKPDLTAEPRPVVVAQEVEGQAVVEQGLAPGERVVTDGQLRLVPGSKVDLKTPAPAAGASS
jgi:membrane fusion protein, multidrug efflux system